MIVDHLSYSALSSYMMCPRKFYYDRVEELPFEEAYWPYLGKVGHAVIAEHFNAVRDGSRKPREELVGSFSTKFDNRMLLHERATGIDWKEQKEGAVKDMGIMLMEAFLDSLAAEVKPLMIEYEWEREVQVDGESVPIQGRIDMIDEDGRLIDWKITKRKKSQKKVDRSLQPTVYAFGMGGPTEFAFGFILKHVQPKVRFVETHRGPGDIKWFEEQIVPAYWRLIGSEHFPPCDPSFWLCQEKYCEHWDKCRGKSVSIWD